MAEAKRNVVVIGASMGGIAAISYLLGQLPHHFPAAIFVVQHRGTRTPSTLVQILERAGQLKVSEPSDGERFSEGQVYLAPADQHLTLVANRICLSGGPRENRSRPAIDPLMRSAAVAWRSQVVGMLLTGYLDDGCAGLLAVKRCGGLAVVQSPTDAEAPELPRNAINRVPVDHVVPIAEMGPLLEKLVYEPAPKAPPVPEELAEEVKKMAKLCDGVGTDERWGKASTLICPDCGGVLQEIETEEPTRYRCRVGHGYSISSLAAEKADVTERALWAGVRSLEEQADLFTEIARKAAERKDLSSVNECEKQAEELTAHAQQIRATLKRQR